MHIQRESQRIPPSIRLQIQKNHSGQKNNAFLDIGKANNVTSEVITDDLSRHNLNGSVTWCIHMLLQNRSIYKLNGGTSMTIRADNFSGRGSYFRQSTDFWLSTNFFCFCRTQSRFSKKKIIYFRRSLSIDKPHSSSIINHPSSVASFLFSLQPF